MLVKKEQKWGWKKEQEKAFGKLKIAFTIEPVLVISDIDKEIRVKIDALYYTMRGALSTKCKDRKWRLVFFISKSLNAIEQNYEIHDKEMLVVIQCLEVWRHYLEGTKQKFEI